MIPLVKNLHRVSLVLLAIGLGTSLAFAWNAARNPVSGGGQPDGFWASREKARIYASFGPATQRGIERLTPRNANGWFGVFAEPIQSFEKYQSQNPTRPTPARRVLVLQPLGESPEERELLEPLRAYCSAFFQIPARVAAPLSLAPGRIPSRPSGYFPGRQQFNASALLKNELEPRLPPDAAAFLGITMEDLWADNLSFVFGLGSWHERVGVYSMSRYFPRKRKGKLSPLERKRALRRAMQVLNHETGHMLGLWHCTLYKCSMNGANSLADADQTPLEFCPLCEQKIAWNIGFNPSRRAAQLRAFYRKYGLEDALIHTPTS